nr:class I SAM-dependent methyltransferase [Clostridium sp. CCUG 7971]
MVVVINIFEELKKYYEDYDEDSRLIKDKAHNVEFITTVNYLDKYIKNDNKILEVGAGTGRYSFYYSEKGVNVTALELCEKHVEIMKGKSSSNSSNIEIIQGNVLDLSMFNDNTFDVILCLGPLYHLTTEKDRDTCIKECLRVLKPKGVLAISYTNRLSQFIKMMHRNKDNINDIELKRVVEHGCEFGDSRDVFYFSNYDEIEALMNSNSIEKLHHLGTDGVSDLLRNEVNQFEYKEFDLWIKYHLDTCEDKSIIGYSMHGLYIGRKL